MNAISQALSLNCKRASRLSRMAKDCYRFYFHWRSQERLYRRSAEALSAIQWKKFKEMLEYAYHRIPYYQDRFRQAGITPEDIRKRDDVLRIPALTKDDIRRNFPDRLVEGGRQLGPSMIGRTSGSTSEGLHFARPEDAWRRTLFYSVLLRKGMANYIVLVHTTPHCTAHTCSLDEAENFQAGTQTKMQTIWQLRHLNADIGLPSSQDILCASDEYMERLGRIISGYAPSVMIVDPVYFGSFARFLKRTGTAVPEIKSIITTFELLTGSLKDLLTEVFGCEIYTQYGSSEIQDVADECEHHRLHVRSNFVMVEVLRDGRPAGPGEAGRAVITDLQNCNMPFIRYDIGDVVAAGNGKCPCGRNTPTLECVHGRVNDLIRPDGAAGAQVVTPLQADGIFRGLRGIAAYRLVQQAKNLYEVSLMRDGRSGEIDTQTLIRRGRSLLGEGSQFRVELVDEIKPQASKKYRFVYSELPPVQL